MTTEDHDHHEAAIDQTLAALRQAAPPEGMEARIAARLTRAATTTPARSRLASLAPSPAWWSGALTGALTATLLVGTTLRMQHQGKAQSAEPNAVIKPTAQSQESNSPQTLPSAITAVAYCPAPRSKPAVQRVNLIPDSPAPLLHYASFSPSRPLPVPPPTAQERELMKVARAVDPKTLASLNSDAQARLEADDKDQFTKFFAAPSTSTSIMTNQ